VDASNIAVGRRVLQETRPAGTLAGSPSAWDCWLIAAASEATSAGVANLVPTPIQTLAKMMRSKEARPLSGQEMRPRFALISRGPHRRIWERRPDKIGLGIPGGPSNRLGTRNLACRFFAHEEGIAHGTADARTAASS
jgi:hypothetical protein